MKISKPMCHKCKDKDFVSGYYDCLKEELVFVCHYCKMKIHNKDPYSCPVCGNR